MAKHLERNQSTVQFDKYHGGRCVWGLLPLHLSSLMKLKSRTKPKHEGHSKYGLKIDPRESDNNEEYESRKRNSSCSALVCIRPSISTHTSNDNILGEGKAVAQDLEPSSQKVEVMVQKSEHLIEQDESDNDGGDEYQSSKTCEDFFDAYKIDKKLFMKNTRKSDADRCDRLVESPKKVTLKRSGSYPTQNMLGSRYGNLQPSKLEDKLIEVWPSGSSTASPFSSSSPSSSTTSSSSHQFDNIKLLRSHSMLSKLPMDRRVEGKHRRTLSLNGSVERYNQLLETCFRKDLKLNFSNSVKLSNEDGIGNNLSESSMLRKAHSMQEALQVERSCSIALPKDLSRSETIRSGIYFHEQSDSEVNEDEPGTIDMQNISKTTDIIDLTDLPNALKQLMEDLTGFQYSLKDQLLSHLVNEVLYDIYEECDVNYWPTSLGSKCRVHLQPQTEEEVSRKAHSRIERLRGFIVEASNDVKSVTAHELVNSYGWMNLQVDAECLGLALEEMLFDELLEELVCE